MRKYLPLIFQPRLCVLLTLGFIIATAVGTVSHEAGHCVVASALGHDANLHYASMNFSNKKEEAAVKFFIANKLKIKSNARSHEKAVFRRMSKEVVREKLFITLGGPIQTMLTGIAGFALLWFRRQKIYSGNKLSTISWMAVFLCFFWSRQVFNFIFSMSATFSAKKIIYKSDEPKISQLLNLPPWVFGLVTAVTGIVLLAWVTLKVIPAPQRLSFIVAGLLGSASGWYIWMHWLGPAMLP